MRNAAGQVSFRDGRVAPCAAIRWSGGPEASAAVRDVLGRHGATQFSSDVAQTTCPEGNRSYDIVAVERGLFRNATPEVLRGLVADIAGGRLTVLEPPVTAADINAARLRLQREREVADGLRDGTLQGVGLLLLGGPARKVCAAGAGIGQLEVPAVKAAILEWRLSLPSYLATDGSDVAVYDRNGVLAAARRGDCGAILGDAATLRDIMAELGRDRLSATPAPVWLTVPQWEALLRRHVPITVADRRRALEPAVKPLGQRLVADLATYIAADGRTGPVGTEFASFGQWYGDRRTAAYTLAIDRFEIDDYGDATWSGGSLPVASVVVYFTLTRAGASGAESNCMIFVWLDDAAAGTRREPAAFKCDALGEIQQWKRQRAVRSKWT